MHIIIRIKSVYLLQIRKRDLRFHMIHLLVSTHTLINRTILSLKVPQRFQISMKRKMETVSQKA